MAAKVNIDKKYNATIDAVKLFLAYLVVGIHTEPLGFSFLLDKGFGIVTRVCVPFFFVASSYFFFAKNGSPISYIKRLLVLYFVWSLIYLPFDIAMLRAMPVSDLLARYLWNGNEHALWYLCSSIIGFTITFVSSKIISTKKILILGILFLMVGCLKSTYAAVLEKLLPIKVFDCFGSRNGLFYGFPYYALGFAIAKSGCDLQCTRKRNLIGAAACLCLLSVESILLVLVFHAQTTILWLSAFPLTYFLFLLCKQIDIQLSYKTSLLLRKLSTLIYVSHGLFMILFAELTYWRFFLAVSAAATVLSLSIIYLSEIKVFKWMKILF